MQICTYLGIFVGMVAGNHGGDHSDEKGFMINMRDMGRRMTLGEMYDARTDTVVAGYLWPDLWTDDKLSSQVVEIPAKFSEYKFVQNDRWSDKMELLDIYGELSLSLKGGMIKGKGSISYIDSKKTTTKSVRMSCKYSVRTVKRKINAFSQPLINAMIPHASPIYERATHVVTGVTWGADSIVSFEHAFSNNDDKFYIKATLELSLKMTTFEVSGKAAVTFDKKQQETINSTNVYVFGDVLADNTRLPTTPAEAMEFVQKLNELAAGANIGVPMELEMTPISWIPPPGAVQTAQLAHAVVSLLHK